MESLQINPEIDPQPRRGLLIFLIVLGFVVRIALLCISIGSYDALLWERFAAHVVREGVYNTYRYDPWVNHPPLPVIFGGLVYRFSQVSGLPFTFLFRIPQILADGLACFLFYRIYRERSGAHVGLIAAAVFACNFDAILVSAFHCNTDAFYSMLCIAAIWFANSKHRPFLAGILLGAAINTKLLPAVFVLPTLLLSRSWKEFFKITAALALMSIPFLWVWMDLGFRFSHQVLSYTPKGGSGLSDILLALENHPMMRLYFENVMDRYATTTGKVMALAAATLPTLMMRQRSNFDRWRACAMAAVILALFAPGFAIQYTAMVGVVLLACDLRVGAIWGLLSGFQLFTFYLFSWKGKFPILADYMIAQGPTKYFEMLALGWVFYWLFYQLKSLDPNVTAAPRSPQFHKPELP
jgi:hypothetical protein